MNFFQKKIITVIISFVFIGSSLSLLAQVTVQGQTAAAPEGSLHMPLEPLPEALAKLEESPVTLIGMTLQELLVSFGIPVLVAAVRGAEPWQDDIVFTYTGGLSFYIYKNRVWKIKISAEYRKPFMGLLPGSPADIAVSLFGLPKMQDSQYAEWIIPFENWPMRLRILYDANGKITTVFLYRADI